MAKSTRRTPAAAPPPKASPQTAALSPWDTASNRALQREVKRNAVLQTAAQLFNERGFHATSLDDIAERLNVTKPTLYYYVESKDQILLECVRTALDLMHDGIEAVRAAGGSAIEQLKACMRIYTGVVTQDFGMCVIRIGEDPLPAPLKTELRRLKAGIDRQFRRLIADGVAEGSLAPCDPKMAAFMLAGALSWVGRWYRSDGHLAPEEIADQGIELLLNGVLQRPVSARRKAASKLVTKTPRKKGKT